MKTTTEYQFQSNKEIHIFPDKQSLRKYLEQFFKDEDLIILLTRNYLKHEFHIVPVTRYVHELSEVQNNSEIQPEIKIVEK